MLIKVQSPVLWDIGTQSIEDLPLKGQINLDPRSVAFSPSGVIIALVVASSIDSGVINFWSTRSKTVLAQLKFQASSHVRVAISADGLQAAVATDSSIALWDLKV